MRSNQSEEDIEFDDKKDFDDRLKESLEQTVTKSGVTQGRKIGYLNALAKLWSTPPEERNTRFTFAEILLW